MTLTTASVTAGVLQPTLPGFEITPVGLARTGSPIDTDQITAALRAAPVAETSWNFLIGDLVLALLAELPHGQAMTAVADAGLEQAQLARCVAVADAVAHDRRRAELTWSHHVTVAHLTPDTQTRLLAVAVDEGLSVRALRSVIAQETADLAGPQLELVDPPPLPRPPASPLRAILTADPNCWVLWQPSTGALRPAGSAR